ncbi:MAG: hypothetical protein WB586_11975 [Chthoniobacterales bacterium]
MSNNIEAKIVFISASSGPGETTDRPLFVDWKKETIEKKRGFHV